MNNIERNQKILRNISRRNRELDGRADYHEGLRAERKRILDILNKYIKESDNLQGAKLILRNLRREFFMIRELNEVKDGE